MDLDTVKFSPADYDYLDNITLPEYIEEFLKRNAQFQKDYKKLNTLAAAYNKEKPNKLFPFWQNMHKKYGVWVILKPNPFYPKVKLKSFKKSNFIAVPHEPVTIHENVSPKVWEYLRPDGTRYDKLMVSLSLHYTHQEILDKLLLILKQHRRKSNFRKEWKYYLMAWDLKNKHPRLTYTKMGDKFMKFEELPESFQEMRNIENYYTKAKNLILGGYKSYL